MSRSIFPPDARPVSSVRTVSANPRCWRSSPACGASRTEPSRRSAATCAQRGTARSVYPRIAYMPQGLGRNLYPTLSVAENIDFFGRLFGQDDDERRQRIDELAQSTGLAPFLDRPAGKLSGGMKQKLSLCCSLVHDPELLILDEPTTGVDPLSRRQFWELIDRIRARNARNERRHRDSLHGGGGGVRSPDRHGRGRGAGSRQQPGYSREDGIGVARGRLHRPPARRAPGRQKRKSSCRRGGRARPMPRSRRSTSP